MLELTSYSKNNTFDTLLLEIQRFLESYEKHKRDNNCLSKYEPCLVCKDSVGFFRIDCDECRERNECQLCNQFQIYQTILEHPDEDNFMEDKDGDDLEVLTNPQMLVLDNFENLLGQNDLDKDLDAVKVFYRELQHFIRQTGFNYRVIFVSSKNIDLCDSVPKLNLTYPPKEYMAQYVSKIIHNELNDENKREKINHIFKIDNSPDLSEADEERRRQSTALMQSNISNLVSQIVESLYSHITDYTLTECVAKKFLDYSLEGKPIKIMGSNTSNILSNRCSQLSRILMCSTKAGFRPISDLKRQMEIVFEGSEKDVKSVLKIADRVTKAEYGLAHKQELDKFDLPPIPAVLLISCYIANHTSDKKDQRMFGQMGRFKNTGGRKAATKPEDLGKNKAKPASKERIEFIAQFLMELVLRNKDKIKEVRELSLGHQSTQFISSYHMLEEFRFIKRHCPLGIDEFSNIRFETKCEAATVQKLAENYDITLEEFVSIN